jgi:hypothetical protein
MTTFSWIIVGFFGLAALFGLAYVVRALNGWLFKVNDVLALLAEIRDALKPAKAPAVTPRPPSPLPAAAPQ